MSTRKRQIIGHRKCFDQQRIALLLVSLYFHFLLHLQFLQFLSFPNHVKFLFPFFSGRVCYKVLERIMPEKLVLRKENLLMVFLLDCILFLLFLCCCFLKVESSCDERGEKKSDNKKQVFKTCLELVEYKALGSLKYCLEYKRQRPLLTCLLTLYNGRQWLSSWFCWNLSK